MLHLELQWGSPCCLAETGRRVRGSCGGGHGMVDTGGFHFPIYFEGQIQKHLYMEGMWAVTKIGLNNRK